MPIWFLLLSGSLRSIPTRVGKSVRPTWTRAKGGQEPQLGDAGGIYFPSKKRIAHTFLIKSCGRVVVTIEGNTSPEAGADTAADRDGGGFWSKRRLPSQIYSVRNWIGNN